MISGDVPLMRLAPQGIGPGMVCVSAGVRAMMDAWMVERFGVVDGLTMRNGIVTAECLACGCDYEWESDPLEGYDHDVSYCGRSDRCMP